MLIKLEWLDYRTVKRLWQYVKPFSSDIGTYGRTDGRTTDLLYQYRASVCWRAIKIQTHQITHTSVCVCRIRRLAKIAEQNVMCVMLLTDGSTRCQRRPWADDRKRANLLAGLVGVGVVWFGRPMWSRGLYRIGHPVSWPGIQGSLFFSIVFLSVLVFLSRVSILTLDIDTANPPVRLPVRYVPV